MNLSWKKLIVVLGGALTLVGIASLIWKTIQKTFLSPSGAAYQWAMGIGIVLLLGIIGISIAFSWLRRRDDEREQSKASTIQTP